MEFLLEEESTPPTEHIDIYRKMLTRVVAITVLEHKLHTNINASCLEMLTDLLQSILVALGSTARAYAEHNGRVEANLHDVLLAFNKMRIPCKNLDTYARRTSRILNFMPGKLPTVRPPSLLRVVPFQPHKPHIPNYLPPLPDTHAYHFTKAKQKVEPNYVRIREKSSTQKCQLSHSLSHYLANTSESINLLGADSPDTIFKVIKPVPMWPSYLNGIMPSDQYFDFEELEYFYASAHSTWLLQKRQVCLYDTDQSDIDNPFLKAAKMQSSKKNRTKQNCDYQFEEIE